MINTDSPNFSKCSYSYQGPWANNIPITKKNNALFEGLIYDAISVNDRPYLKAPFYLSWKLNTYWLTESNDVYNITKL